MKTFYLFNPLTGELLGSYDAQPSPLEPGVFIHPVDSTEVPPQAPLSGFTRNFIKGQWVSLAIPPAPEPEPPKPEEPPTPLERIEALESANPFTHRALREISLTVAQLASLALKVPVSSNPKVVELLALEAQIAALRSQL